MGRREELFAIWRGLESLGSVCGLLCLPPPPVSRVWEASSSGLTSSIRLMWVWQSKRAQLSALVYKYSGFSGAV